MVTFKVKVALLNRHLAAASKDSTRKTLKNTILFHAHDGVLDMVSTDGRVLLHTQLIAASIGCAEAFGETVLCIPSGKVSGGKNECAMVTIDGANSRIATTKGTIMPEVLTEEYPRWRSLLLADDAKRLDAVRWFDPKYLQLVYDYIEQSRSAYTNPQGDVRGPVMWTLRSADGEIRRAVLMPLPAA